MNLRFSQEEDTSFLDKEGCLETSEQKEKEFEIIKSEIEELFRILKPKNEDNLDQDFEKLFSDAEKVLQIKGNLIPPPEEVIKTAKQMLVGRLEALVQKAHTSKKKVSKEKDIFVLRRARLALLKEHNDEWRSKIWSDEKDFSEFDLSDFFHVLNFDIQAKKINTEGNFWEKAQKLSADELEILTNIGYVDGLVARNKRGLESYDSFKKVELIPENLFIEICKSPDHSYSVIQQSLELAQEKKFRYSKEAFHALVMARPEYVLRYADVFEGLSMQDAIDIEIVSSTHGWTRNIDFKDTDLRGRRKYSHIASDHELFKYFIQNSRFEYSSFSSIKEADNPVITNAVERFRELPMRQYADARHYLEARKLIEEGYLSFFASNSSQRDYIDHFFTEDRDWIWNLIREQNKEHLILDYHLAEGPKREYAKKLISHGEINKLYVALTENVFTSYRQSSGERWGVLTQEIFDLLPEEYKTIDILKSFSKLNQATFDQLSGNYSEENIFRFFKELDVAVLERLLAKDFFTHWSKIENSMQHFNLEKTPYPVLKAEIESIEGDNAKFLYFNYFKKEVNAIKREFGKKLFTEARHISENDDFIVYYFKKFIDSDDSVERKLFLENYNMVVDTICKSVSLPEMDKELYTTTLKEVYPKRNYDTYQYIHEYKDRTEDLASYTFEQKGYDMRLSGVLGYRIKEGTEADSTILSQYQARIQGVEDMAKSDEKILQYIKENIPEVTAKTLEGKVLEYVRLYKATPQAIDLLLAYQLRGSYDQFVHESQDRTDMYEGMKGKEYIMLTELSERYGDIMKETLKAIASKVSESEDAKLFVKDNGKELEKGDTIAKKIVEELARVPFDKLTTETIQKKVAKTLINTYQQMIGIKSLAEVFSGAFTKENFSDFELIFKERLAAMLKEGAGETAIDMQFIESSRQKTYETIKKELDKYEEIKEVDEGRKGEKKMSKERLIKGYFSKNKENAHARMEGDICIAANPKMLENKNYFEFVMFDEDRKKCVGTVMLLRMDEPDDKKYLLYCPNPSVDLVSQVSAERLYKLIIDTVKKFALDNGFDGVLLDKRHGHATNRSGLFQTTLEKSVLRESNGEERTFNLVNKHELSGNYVYQDNLKAVWLKEQ